MESLQVSGDGHANKTANININVAYKKGDIARQCIDT